MEVEKKVTKLEKRKGTQVLKQRKREKKKSENREKGENFTVEVKVEEKTQRKLKKKREEKSVYILVISQEKGKITLFRPRFRSKF